MAAQTFNPSDLSRDTVNWAVAQRMVGSFAPHAQVTPNMTVAVDPGYLFDGITLIEVNAQSVGPIAPPASGFRIDRVVTNRVTGAASVVSGVANSLKPPAIPSNALPCARVFLQSTTTEITNAVLYNERALSTTTAPSSTVICRATLGGSTQTGVAHNTFTKVNLSTADINIGNGFDATNK